MLKIYEPFQKANTEKKFKTLFTKLFYRVPYYPKDYVEFCSPMTLCIVRFEDDLTDIDARAACVAQGLYSVRYLITDGTFRPVPNRMHIITRTSGLVLDMQVFSKYLLPPQDKNFDWEVSYKSPCKKLLEALKNDVNVKNCKIYDFSGSLEENDFSMSLNFYLEGRYEVPYFKKVLNEDNCYAVFKTWAEHFGAYLKSEQECVEYFLIDIEKGRSALQNDGTVLFQRDLSKPVQKILPVQEYKMFWLNYEKIQNPETLSHIRKYIHLMSQVELSRLEGDYCTPFKLAQKAAKFLLQKLDKDWYLSGKYRIWDMTAGAGNLEIALPVEALKYCYISTLQKSDADYCKKIFTESTVFQYDYLNDDVESLFSSQTQSRKKMPKKLIEDLNNPEIKWIIFFNPPYEIATNIEEGNDIKLNRGIPLTKIKKIMNSENIGRTNRATVVQFLYRINKEFANRQTTLGFFAKQTYINSANNKEIREKFFDYKFEGGFIFDSQFFKKLEGSSKMPYCFAVWNMSEHIPLKNQEISFKVYDHFFSKIAIKTVKTVSEDIYLRDWITSRRRSLQGMNLPPFSHPLKIAYHTTEQRTKVAKNFVASFVCTGNDFFHRNFTNFLSGAYANPGGISVNAENFERAMIVHAVRRIPPEYWYNIRDQFTQPNKELSMEFICDCVIWSLFSQTNLTVSLSNVVYKNQTYRLKNNFYPWLLAEVSTWECSMPKIKSQIENELEDRFVAIWIGEHFDYFSSEAWEVLAAGQVIYKKFYCRLADLEYREFKIDDWDAGWYQVRMSLEEEDLKILKEPMQKLSEKIFPQFYELGFLRDKVIQF